MTAHSGRRIGRRSLLAAGAALAAGVSCGDTVSEPPQPLPSEPEPTPTEPPPTEPAPTETPPDADPQAISAESVREAERAGGAYGRGLPPPAASRSGERP